MGAVTDGTLRAPFVERFVSRWNKANTYSVFHIRIKGIEGTPGENDEKNAQVDARKGGALPNETPVK